MNTKCQTVSFSILDILEIPLIKKKNILLVAGIKSYKNFLENPSFSLLKKELTWDHFYHFTPNPKKKEIEEGVKIFKKKNYNAIFTIGGGSAIDVGKLIKFFSKSKVPIYALPTTCGTGSEATTFATFYDHFIKKSIDDSSLLPDHIILDSSFLKTLPAYTKGNSLGDSLCHAVESYWNINSTSESLEYAEKAISSIINHSEDFMKNNKKDLFALKASHYAGKAINITRTTAAHALSYSLTSQFNIPHGQSVALFLPHLFKFNINLTEKNCADKRGPLFVQERFGEISTLLKAKSLKEADKRFEIIFNIFGLKNSLKKLNILKIPPSFDLQVNSDRLKNNPRMILPKDVDYLFEKIKKDNSKE